MAGSASPKTFSVKIRSVWHSFVILFLFFKNVMQAGAVLGSIAQLVKTITILLSIYFILSVTHTHGKGKFPLVLPPAMAK